MSSTVMSSSEIEDRLNAFVWGYVTNDVDSRLPHFANQHLRGFKKIALRQLKYSIPDALIQTRNTISWTVKKCGGHDFSRPTYAGMALTQIFTDEVFCLNSFKEQLKRFMENDILKEQGTELECIMQDLNAGAKRGKALDQALRSELLKSTAEGRSISSAVCLVLDALIATAVTGKLSRGAGAAGGVAVAQQTYLANVGFFGGLWVQIAGFPAWLSVAGSVAGGTLATVLLAPVVGSIMEYAASHFGKHEIIIRKGYPRMVESIVYGTPGQDSANLLESTVQWVSVVMDALDKFRTISVAIA